MPKLTDHKSREIVKLILEGDAGIGKTSALVSLVKAGYSLRILDFDNLLTPLVHRIREECPDRMASVSYATFRDKLKGTTAGPMVDGAPKAIMEAMKMLDRWKTADEDLGVPATWGDSAILVIDSLTRLSDMAMNWGAFLAPSSGDGKKDGRAIYGEAQRIVEAVLSLITSESFNTNVIVLAHVKYVERPDGTTKGYPIGPGSALGPVIPSYFETVLLAERSSDGKSRTIRAESTALIELKNPVGKGLPSVLPLATGLATFFEAVKGGAKQAA
jgi:hypothetical protein